MGEKVCVTAAVLALVACDHPTGPSGGGRIALVMAAAGTGMDSGYVRLSGTASRTVKLVPPATLTIDGLNPGPYTVTLEGFVGAVVDRFFHTDVNVAKGQNTSVIVTATQFASFVPAARAHCPRSKHIGRSEGGQRRTQPCVRQAISRQLRWSSWCVTSRPGPEIRGRGGSGGARVDSDASHRVTSAPLREHHRHVPKSVRQS